MPGRGFNNLELARVQNSLCPPHPSQAGVVRASLPVWVPRGHQSSDSWGLPPVGAGPAQGSCTQDGGRCWGGLAVGPESAQVLLEVRAQVRRLLRAAGQALRLSAVCGGASGFEGRTYLGACPGLGPARAEACGARGLEFGACSEFGARTLGSAPCAGQPSAPRAPSRPLALRAGPARLASGPERRGRRGRAGQGWGGAEARPERSPSGAGGGGRGRRRWRTWGCSSWRARGTRTRRAGLCCCWASCPTCTACPGATSAGSCSPGSPRR